MQNESRATVSRQAGATRETRFTSFKALAALAIFSLLLAGCHPAPAVHMQESYVFGTRVEVQVWSRHAKEANLALATVLAEFDRLHREFHAWQPSQLTALNDAIAAGEPFEAGPELAGYVRQAQEFARLSGGLFDPGIGELVRLWGFENDVFAAKLPDPAQLAALQRSKPSILDLYVDGERILSANRTVALDFGGYLKGVALDRAADILRQRGFKNALINIGGNVMALGAKGKTPWRVAIQHPRESEPIATLDLQDGEAIGTSGDYQRYFMLDGKRYCHLIDPRTGRPSEGAQAVTVLVTPRADGATGAWSDWASKPLFISGDDWRPLAKKLGLDEVLRIAPDGRIETTDAMKARLSFATPPPGAK